LFFAESVAGACAFENLFHTVSQSITPAGCSEILCDFFFASYVRGVRVERLQNIFFRTHFLLAFLFESTYNYPRELFFHAIINALRPQRHR